MSNENKRLPEPEFNAQYPFNQVHISRSGHERHVDDTPGHERLREAHKSGTFWEISPDGRRVTLVVHDEYHYVKGGMTLTIDNNYDVRVGGNMRLIIDGDCHAEVRGNMTSVVGGDSTVATLGDSIQMVEGDAYTKVKGSMSTSVNGNMNAEIKKDAELSIGGDVALVAKGDIDIEGRNIRLDAKTGKLTLKGKDITVVKG